MILTLVVIIVILTGLKNILTLDLPTQILSTQRLNQELSTLTFQPLLIKTISNLNIEHYNLSNPDSGYNQTYIMDSDLDNVFQPHT